MEQEILKIKDLHVHYGAIHAIKGLNLTLKKGEIVTILGSNGAGKTTTLKSISGLIPSTSGSITFNNRPIHRWKAHKIVAAGMAQSPEGRLIFPDLTVDENLEMGAYLRSDTEQVVLDKKYVCELFPILSKRSSQLAGTLSGGEQQMLAISRAYMSRPSVLLLDEPSLGIAPILVKTIFRAIKEINTKGTSILLVEQNAYAALKVAHRGYVLQTGRILFEGPSQELLNNQEIKKAYLGH
jgi:branched-chain amino acid transport system ATP-binding protein